MQVTHQVLNANRMKWRRRDLRKRSTAYEHLLWEELRNIKLGMKFKRQYSVMNFVVDFYCHNAKLAVEIDGGVHNTPSSIQYDKYRTEYLRTLGIKEIRFNNADLLNNLSEVLLKISQNLPSPEIRRGTRE
ncbi:hypothetical protein A2379_03075 [Candidatus Amesbacteria bacterium RIFOXYB1_FULL_47_13]|nr:MAG: hypothetical protein A2379_03075 [Candidatus Amesbacteria bacterium RIFOXYB1_FULL_47_13]HBC72361.1 hypothetical protein [Candidatus Amesbacteria bacterium]